MKRVLLSLSVCFSVLCFKGYSQGTTCATATPFCTAVGTPFTYANSTTGDAGTVKCLQTTPGPNWFWVKTTTPGTYVFNIKQSTTPNGSANIDVDFIAFGPYSAPQCSFGSGGGGLTNDCTSIGTPWGEVEDCSYCWDPTETMTLRPTSNCQVYMVLVTNYSRQSGYITFTQTSGPSTDCNITNPVAWTAPGPLCAGAAPVDLNATITQGGTGGTWSGTGVSGSTFDPSVSGTGTFAVTYTIAGGTCPSSATHNITVTSGTTPTFTQLGPYCVGNPPGTLPSTSNEGITGTWNPASISTATAGTTTCTFTPDAGQCALPVTMDIVVNSTGQTPTFNQLGPYCVGSFSGMLPGTSNEGITGSWSPLFINTGTAGTTVFTFTPDAGQCAGSTTMTVTVSNSITPTFNPMGPYCVGSAADPLPAASAEGATGSWNPSSINTSTAGSFTYTFTPSGGSCYTSTTMTIVVSSGASVSITANPAQICEGQSTTLTANGATDYTWNPGNLTGSSVTVSPTTTTDYTVTATINGGCSGTAGINVTVLPSPVVTVTAAPGSVCQGDCSSLTATGATTYTWQPGSLSGAAVQVCPAATTTYTVVGSNGSVCENTAIVTVSVTPVPQLNVSASANDLCAGESTTLSVSGAGNYLWQPGNAGGSTITVNPSATTTYTVTGDINTCTASGTITINVYPYPVVSFNADLLSGCEDLLVQFSDLSNQSNVTWHWDFGDNSTSDQQHPLHLFTNAGTYTVTLTLTNEYGCSSSYTWTDMITVFPNPVADFVHNPQVASVLEPDIDFFDRSINAVEWSWNFGDTSSTSNLSDQANPSHSYSYPGTYTVMLIVTSEHGCTDTTLHTVIIEPNITFWMPNAFSPNDDFENQYFIGKGEGIQWETFEMYIFNRWGQELLKTSDYERGWDGTYKGKTVPEGVYVWLVFFKDINGKKYYLKGIVTVLL